MEGESRPVCRAFCVKVNTWFGFSLGAPRMAPSPFTGEGRGEGLLISVRVVNQRAVAATVVAVVATTVAVVVTVVITTGHIVVIGLLVADGLVLGEGSHVHELRLLEEVLAGDALLGRALREEAKAEARGEGVDVEVGEVSNWGFTWVFSSSRYCFTPGAVRILR